MFRHDLSATAADVLHGVSAHFWYDACISVVGYCNAGTRHDNWYLSGHLRIGFVQHVPILHYIIPQVWGACAPCFSPWYTRTLFLFPSQGHFWLFVEFCGWLLPALLVLVFGLSSFAGYMTLQYQKHTDTSGYCTPFASSSFTRRVFSHPCAWIGFQWQLGRTLCGFMLPPYSLVACFASMTYS